MIEAAEMAVQAAPVLKSLQDVPQFLIPWSSPWEEFITSIRPALQKSPKPLAGEAPIKIFPFPGMLVAWLLESALLIAVIVLPAKLASLQPYVPPVQPKYDVIYFSGDELPQTEDIGGAEKGKSGAAGGRHAQHHTQTIRVVRGDSPLEKVVDAPKINLPKSDFPVANLLAIHNVPGPPPTSGLRSSTPVLPTAEPVGPAPNISRDQLPQTAALSTSIVAPPPEVSREKVHALPNVAAAVIAPPPSVERDKMRSLHGVNNSVVAPPPEVAREKMRAMQAVNGSIIAPPPSVQQEIAGTRLPSPRGVDVVPPPVSAVPSEHANPARLSLPQAGVIAPPPSEVTRELGSHGQAHSQALHTQIVPPPVDVGSQMGQRTSTAALSTAIVPPPPTVSGGGSVTSGRYAGRDDGTTTVVPPPPSANSGSLGARTHAGNVMGNNVEVAVASPPAKATGGAGNTAPKTAVVVSSQPGSRVGLPGVGGAGAIAVSPAGGSTSGVGGSGNGGGLGRGNGPGSGLTGEGTGAASSGAGRGSDPTSKSGMSPYPGTGGAGTSVAGRSSTPGISVSGGNTITLPSFGAGANGPGIADPSHTLTNKGAPGVTIIASSRSGGAFNFYGTLKGDPVYTIYFQTTLGTAVLQYADTTSAHHVYAQELAAPQPLRADLPAGLNPSRIVIACILDPTGVLRNVRMLEGGSAPASAKVLAALSSWKFKPAFRGDQAIEVNAILGFNIDTR